MKSTRSEGEKEIAYFGGTRERLSVRKDKDGGPHLVQQLVLAGGWHVEMRLALQKDRLVVASVHVRPETGPLGLLSDVPSGGITMRLLRSVPVYAHTRGLEAMLRAPPEAQVLDALLVGTPAEVLLKAVRPVVAETPRRGRRPVSTETLVEVAAEYAKAVRRGSEQPIIDTAKALRQRVTTVRNHVYRARKRGLLTKAGWGQSGGELTDEAKALKKNARTRKGGRR